MNIQNAAGIAAADSAYVAANVTKSRKERRARTVVDIDDDEKGGEDDTCESYKHTLGICQAVSNTKSDLYGRQLSFRTSSCKRENCIVVQTIVHTKNTTNQQCDIDSWSFSWGYMLPPTLPIQKDDTSCGVFVAITIYYLVVMRRWPKREDFTEGNVPMLRLFMIKVILQTNRMYVHRINENWFDDENAERFQLQRQQRK